MCNVPYGSVKELRVISIFTSTYVTMSFLELESLCAFFYYNGQKSS